MIIRPAAKRPPKAALVGADRQVVDTGIALPHQASIVKLPILVAERSEPVPTVVTPLIGEPDGNSVAAESPEFLDQPVIQLSPPFSRKKRYDRFAPAHEFSTVTPLAVYRICRSDPRRVAAVPAVFSKTNFLDCVFERKRRKGWSLSFGHLSGFSNRARKVAFSVSNRCSCSRRGATACSTCCSV